jgi:RNA polymerase sigma-70 factor (ECF subfamily)
MIPRIEPHLRWSHPGHVIRLTGVTQILTEGDFETITAPLRGELMAHCYRMLGSVQDAEDQVQETYLRAWRAYHGFEGRSSARTWMYQIATRTCLTALEQRARRPMPTGLGAPAADPVGELESRPEVPWLEPIPDALLAGPGADPASVAASRDGVRLAFVAALQHLTPLQRAVLVMRDVLAFSAAETAQTLDISVPSANSALQRARAGMSRVAPAGADTTDGLSARERDLLDRYVAAFERYDTPAVVALLTEDATWEMPPFTGWYAGAEAIGSLIDTQCPAKAAGDLRFVVTRANGQPAAAAWLRDPDGIHQAFQIHVLDVVPAPRGPAGSAPAGSAAVRHVSCFFDTSLFARFGLPLTLPAPESAGPGDTGAAS